MNQVVLGGAQFGRLSQSRLNYLLDCASDFGVSRIDTAPMYENSESMIGTYLRKKSTFRVITKCGHPAEPELFSREFILSQMSESFARLGSSNIEALFVHSTPFNYIHADTLVAITQLSQKKYIDVIGYSGNGINLEKVYKLKLFNSYMFTLNALDISDAGMFLESSDKFYVKRPLANGVFDQAIFTRTKRCIRALLGIKRNYTSNAYESRLEKLEKHLENVGPRLDFFISFLQFTQPRSNWIFGSNSPRHLKQIMLRVKENKLDTSLFCEYISALRELSKYHNWQSLP